MYTIENNIIQGPDVEYEDTQKISGALKSPMFIVIHGYKSHDDILKDFHSAYAKESTHIVIHEEGEITQYAPLNAKAWHAGYSYWKGYHGLNSFAIGVYTPGTAAAIETMHELLPVIVEEYNIRDIISHSDCSPDRQHCLHLDTSRFKKYVYYGNADAEGRYLIVSPEATSVREGPDVHFPVYDSIDPGESVKVLRYCPGNEWAFVLYERKDHVKKQGWVHESALRRL